MNKKSCCALDCNSYNTMASNTTVKAAQKFEAPNVEAQNCCSTSSKCSSTVVTDRSTSDLEGKANTVLKESTICAGSNVKFGTRSTVKQFCKTMLTVPDDDCCGLCRTTELEDHTRSSAITNNGQRANDECQQRLDLLRTDGLPIMLMEGQLPVGVIAIRSQGLGACSILYDAKRVGARQLLGHPLFCETRLAPVRIKDDLQISRTRLYTLLVRIVISTVLTLPVLVLSWSPRPNRSTCGIRGEQIACLVLATFVQVAIAGPFYISTCRALIISGRPNMDFLVVLSTTIAYGYSVVAFSLQAAGHPLIVENFFETSTLLITLYSLASSCQRLLSMAP